MKYPHGLVSSKMMTDFGWAIPMPWPLVDTWKRTDQSEKCTWLKAKQSVQRLKHWTKCVGTIDSTAELTSPCARRGQGRWVNMAFLPGFRGTMYHDFLSFLPCDGEPGTEHMNNYGNCELPDDFQKYSHFLYNHYKDSGTSDELSFKMLAQY